MTTLVDLIDSNVENKVEASIFFKKKEEKNKKKVEAALRKVQE